MQDVTQNSNRRLPLPLVSLCIVKIELLSIRVEVPCPISDLCRHRLVRKIKKCGSLCDIHTISYHSVQPTLFNNTIEICTISVHSTR